MLFRLLVICLPDDRPDPAGLLRGSACPFECWHRSMRSQTLLDNTHFRGVARIGLRSLVVYYKLVRFDESFNNLTPARTDADRWVLRSGQDDTHHATRNQTANALRASSLTLPTIVCLNDHPNKPDTLLNKNTLCPICSDDVHTKNIL